MRVCINLPKNRTKSGTLRVEDHGKALLAVDCLGKADNAKATEKRNAARHPCKSFGDTPIGSYIGKIEKFSSQHPSMGNGWISLQPSSGQAAEAADAGRTGLGIHAGRGDERLVPTHGCVRVYNADWDRMVDVLPNTPFVVVIEEGE